VARDLAAMERQQVRSWITRGTMETSTTTVTESQTSLTTWTTTTTESQM
jgi:hypothetical protein